MYHIPTTIVTGFLGAGKTSAINHLLAGKPVDKRWAVLVNEFGQVGVDDALIGSRRGVFIREILGGCLCCTAGQAFEVALNRLIRDTRPDRILIEPTGIGHPLKIIRTLTSGFYRDLLDLRATICLVDARKLGDSKYREHPAFQDQLNLADVLVANKADCYSDNDRTAFMELVAASIPPKAAYSMISFGEFDSGVLDLSREPSRMAGYPDAHAATGLPFSSISSIGLPEAPEVKSTPVNRDAWAMHEGSSTGYYSGSWLTGINYCFERESLSALLASFPYARVKGIMQCNDGWMKINGSDGVLELSGSEPLDSSRLEIIDTSPLPCIDIENHLRRMTEKS